MSQTMSQSYQAVDFYQRLYDHLEHLLHHQLPPYQSLFPTDPNWQKLAEKSGLPLEVGLFGPAQMLQAPHWPKTTLALPFLAPVSASGQQMQPPLLSPEQAAKLGTAYAELASEKVGVDQLSAPQALKARISAYAHNQRASMLMASEFEKVMVCSSFKVAGRYDYLQVRETGYPRRRPELKQELTDFSQTHAQAYAQTHAQTASQTTTQTNFSPRPNASQELVELLPQQLLADIGAHITCWTSWDPELDAEEANLTPLCKVERLPTERTPGRRDRKKPVLCLFHGLTCNHLLWEEQLGALLPHYELVVWDMVDHGQSYADHNAHLQGTEPEPAHEIWYHWDLNDQADYAWCLLAALNLLEAKPVMVGHSMGGYFLQAFVRAYPEIPELVGMVGSLPLNSGYLSAEAKVYSDFKPGSKDTPDTLLEKVQHWLASLDSENQPQANVHTQETPNRQNPYTQASANYQTNPQPNLQINQIPTSTSYRATRYLEPGVHYLGDASGSMGIALREPMHAGVEALANLELESTQLTHKQAFSTSGFSASGWFSQMKKAVGESFSASFDTFADLTNAALDALGTKSANADKSAASASNAAADAADASRTNATSSADATKPASAAKTHPLPQVVDFDKMLAKLEALKTAQGKLELNQDQVSAFLDQAQLYQLGQAIHKQAQYTGSVSQFMVKNAGSLLVKALPAAGSLVMHKDRVWETMLQASAKAAASTPLGQRNVIEMLTTQFTQSQFSQLLDHGYRMIALGIEQNHGAILLGDEMNLLGVSSAAEETAQDKAQAGQAKTDPEQNQASPEQDNSSSSQATAASASNSSPNGDRTASAEANAESGKKTHQLPRASLGTSRVQVSASVGEDQVTFSWSLPVLGINTVNHQLREFFVHTPRFSLSEFGDLSEIFAERNPALLAWVQQHQPIVELSAFDPSYVFASEHFSQVPCFNLVGQYDKAGTTILVNKDWLYKGQQALIPHAGHDAPIDNPWLFNDYLHWIISSHYAKAKLKQEVFANLNLVVLEFLEDLFCQVREEFTRL